MVWADMLNAHASPTSKMKVKYLVGPDLPCEFECSVGVGVVGSVPRVTECQCNSAPWLHPGRRRRVEECCARPVSAVRAAPGVDMGTVTLLTSANTN